MNCIKCNMPLENVYVCPHCGHVDKVAKKIIYSSNWHYNQGLAKAKVRDLSGAVTSLSQSLKYNKRNTDARNLLGLIYYQMGAQQYCGGLYSGHSEQSGQVKGCQ